MRKGWLVAVGFGALAVAVVSWWLAGYGMFGPHGMMGYGGMMSGYGGGAGRPGTGWFWMPGMVVGWLGMLAFWAVVLTAAVLAVRALVAPGSDQALPGPENPLEVARRRYAAGEIDRQTFEQLQHDLQP
ncbi:MAG TPA: hypothetical protein VFW96_19160 [Thermomicrobiales bacterium]|nr:hypothetical protein [Thermomicrobiales bacterium]